MVHIIRRNKGWNTVLGSSKMKKQRQWHSNRSDLFCLISDIGAFIAHVFHRQCKLTRSRIFRLTSKLQALLDLPLPFSRSYWCALTCIDADWSSYWAVKACIKWVKIFIMATPSWSGGMDHLREAYASSEEGDSTEEKITISSALGALPDDVQSMFSESGEKHRRYQM